MVQFVRLDMEKAKDRDKLEFEVGRARLAFESHMLFLRPVVDRTRIGKESYDSEPEPTKET